MKFVLLAFDPVFLNPGVLPIIHYMFNSSLFSQVKNGKDPHN